MTLKGLELLLLEVQRQDQMGGKALRPEVGCGLSKSRAGSVELLWGGGGGMA